MTTSSALPTLLLPTELRCPSSTALADSIHNWFVAWIKNPSAGPGWNKVSGLSGEIVKLGVPGNELARLKASRRQYNGVCQAVAEMGSVPWKCAVSCDQPTTYVTNVTSYGDISGPGVVIGFVATAWVVVISVAATYCLSWDAGCGDDQDGTLNMVDYVVLGSMRRFGRKLLRFMDCLIPTTLSVFLSILLDQKRIRRVFNASLLALSDLQIFTGLTIIISGFVSLCPSETEPNGIPAYHWQVLVHLAWFSAITHQGALIFMQKHFQQHPWQRNMRLVFMGALLIMLLIAMVPTAFFNWYSKRYRITIQGTEDDKTQDRKLLLTYFSLARSAAQPVSPALCYFNLTTASTLFNSSQECQRGDLTIPLSNLASNGSSPARRDTGSISDIIDNATYMGFMHEMTCDPHTTILGTASFQATALGMASIAFLFVFNTLRLVGPSSEWLRTWIRNPLSSGSRRVIDFVSKRTIGDPVKPAQGEQFGDIFILKPLLALHITARVILDLLASELAKVLTLVFSVILGCIRLYPAHDPLMHRIQSETWSFGQILAVLTPLSPLALVVQSVFNGGSHAWHSARNAELSQPPETAFTDMELQDPDGSRPRGNPPPASTISATTLSVLSQQKALDSSTYRSSHWIHTAVWLLVGSLILMAFSMLQYIYLGWSAPKKLVIFFAVVLTTFPAFGYVPILLGLTVGTGGTRMSRTLVTTYAILLVGCIVVALFSLRTYLKPVMHPSWQWAWLFVAVAYLPVLVYFVGGIARSLWKSRLPKSNNPS
ncbi:hypothetical protein NM208_g13995 [Fusarium decemcellulare]|uniref:Uncharacterized protein n=1 Tax=Fusarium decemcellulare TaxID=57161 RepID=A0ACC1RIC6_9HYPO|nr:hypothetical protein NM208_g13995 [Fusarium decemcellulare]